MGLISSLFAHKVADVAAASGQSGETSRASLLRSVGIDPNAPRNPKLMVDDAEYYAMCERAMRADQNPHSFPLRVGAAMLCDDYGAFGLAWKTALTLRGSYARAERYGKVLTTVSTYEVRAEGDRQFMLLHRDGKRNLGLRLSNEQTITAVAQISREVYGDAFRLGAVHFKHAAPHDTSAHEDYFGCPVHFSSDRDALEVSAAVLNVDNPAGDIAITRFFDTHLETELATIADDGELARRVRIQVAHALSQGLPTISEVGGRLGMSGRTLQRRLADKNLAFQGLVDEARRELAERLLGGSDYSLAEIAFLTGFSEQSSFNRAFKRWAGQTPRSYRLAALGRTDSQTAQ